MLIHPTLEKLSALKLGGMAQALTEQLQMRDLDGLGFEERLGLLVDREMTERHNGKLRIRLKKAHLRLNAVLEDIDYRQPRGLDKLMILGLASCRWVEEHQTVLITGPTGVIWPAPWPTRRAGKAIGRFTTECPGCCKNWPSPESTAGTARSWSIFSSRMSW